MKAYRLASESFAGPSAMVAGVTSEVVMAFSFARLAVEDVDVVVVVFSTTV